MRTNVQVDLYKTKMPKHFLIKFLTHTKNIVALALTLTFSSVLSSQKTSYKVPTSSIHT